MVTVSPVTMTPVAPVFGRIQPAADTSFKTLAELSDCGASERPEGESTRRYAPVNLIDISIY